MICIAMIVGDSARQAMRANEFSVFSVRSGTLRRATEVVGSVMCVSYVMRTLLQSVRVRRDSYRCILKYCLISGKGLPCPIVSPSKKENM